MPAGTAGPKVPVLCKGSLCCASALSCRRPAQPTRARPPTPAADAVAKQLRIRLVPELVDLGGEKLSVVGEYRLPLKMVLPSGDRVTLDLTVAST